MITSPNAMAQLFQLYRGRPYTKVVPFSLTFAGAVANEAATLYAPQSAFFEFAGGVINSSATAEFALCDATRQNPFTLVIAGSGAYTPIQIGALATYRSVGPTGAKLLLVAQGLVACTVKGVVWIWDVTTEGYYR
jgi:hypothetical protein